MKFMQGDLGTDDVVRAMTSQRVAQELRVSAASIQRYAREGRIPFDVTPGGHRRYSVEEVRRALAGGRRTHVAAIVVSSGKVHLGAGPSVRTSSAEERQRELRAVESAARGAGGTRTTARRRAAKSSATAELFGHARRVLVATSR
jgi:hypothetical protein